MPASSTADQGRTVSSREPGYNSICHSETNSEPWKIMVENGFSGKLVKAMMDGVQNCIKVSSE